MSLSIFAHHIIQSLLVVNALYEKHSSIPLNRLYQIVNDNKIIFDRHNNVKFSIDQRIVNKLAEYANKASLMGGKISVNAKTTVFTDMISKDPIVEGFSDEYMDIIANDVFKFSCLSCSDSLFIHVGH